MSRAPQNRLRSALCALACLPCFIGGAAEAGSNSSSNKSVFAASIKAPQEFAGLSEPRQMIADVYFGGVKIAEAAVTVRPGFVSFVEPSKLAAAIPNLIDPNGLRAALEGDLPSNSGRICSALSAEGCGTLTPDLLGVIFDEDRFRVDIFVNARLLNAISPVESGYLHAPTSDLSMTSSLGLSLSGSSNGPTSYNFQNRSIFALRNARLRTNSSYSSGLGLISDDFVAEIDNRNLRYSAGMFWAPGLDMIGQRRIIGAGVSTQMDTRVDKDLLEGTPLFLFLERAARVEVLADGRLLDSRVYEAGNNRIDSTFLPTGAYSVVLRVHQANGSVREEQRFFARNAQVAPVGKPIYFAFAGVLANTRRNRPFSRSDTFYYQAGTAHRLTSGLALDASVIGTQHKAMVEAGGFFLSSRARIRAALLLSTRGDKGALLQGGTSGNGPLSLNFDFRRIHSSDGKPLIPHALHGENFDFRAPRAAQLGAGSYTQMSGSLGYRLANGFIGVTGAYRRDDGLRSDYSIAPSMSYPLLQKHGLQLLLQADAQRTRNSRAAYAGLRLLKVSNGKALIASTGYGSLRRRGSNGRTSARPVGSIAGEWYHQARDRTEVSVGAVAERTVDDTNARAHGALYTPIGTVRGDVIHHFGDRSVTQHGLSIQTGIATDSRTVVLGGRELMQSALLISVDGDASGSAFDILVDDVSRGRISVGRRLPLYLSPYRSYRVRLKPVDAAAVSFDSKARDFTLYPGTVQTVRWTARRIVTLFGQAVAPGGTPLANARVETGHGLGQTDDQGYFQVDMVAGDEIHLTSSSNTRCRLPLNIPQPERGYASIGKVICQ